MSICSANSVVAANGEATAVAVAHWLTDLAISSDGAFSVCLSGGGTPRTLYRMLTEPPFAGKFPWSRTHWFWGDERFVPADHPDSNYRMAWEAMLGRMPIPAGHIHQIDTGLADEAMAAKDYDSRLKLFLSDVRNPAGKDTLFDVVLLGLGDDGHTASLFPGTPTLAVRDRLAELITGARPEPRVTLTYPAIESSEHVAFIVCGEAKSQVVRAIQGGVDLPAARVKSRGSILWFFDTSAAQDIVMDGMPRAVGA